MNRTLFRTLTWLMWLALPLTALRFWLVWDQLPLRMATHFGASGQPNGWMTREVSLEFALGITACLLLVFTAVLLVVHKQHVPEKFSWALLGFFYLVLGFMYSVNMSVLGYNLRGESVKPGLGFLLLPVAIVALIGIYVSTQRGEPLLVQQWIARETHASPGLAVVFLVPVVVELWIITLAPAGPIRMVGAVMCVLFLVLAAFAWNGFQYNFGPGGLEIRTLGFRLRSIPLAQIQSYGVERWSLLRGYGIRGVGGSRAYVWGNKVVHIRTPQGEVFLGHGDPEQIVRDLDMIRH